MILYFSFNNFRSVKKDCEIDFRKMNLSQHRESVINDKVLPVTVIYGPNGGGKSTIVLALQYLCNLVSIPINQYKGVYSQYLNTFEPFLLDKESKNKKSEFCIIFTLNKNDMTEYKYYISVFNGMIIEENLFEKKVRGKPALVFSRDNNIVSVGSTFNLISQSKSKDLNPSIPYLSLCTIILANSPISKVGSWFTKAGLMDFGNPAIEMILPEIFATLSQQDSIKKNMDELLKKIDLISDYKIEDSGINSITGQRMKQIKTIHKVGGDLFELNYSDESMGTKKIMQIAPIITSSLRDGNLVIIDELDAKLHPKLLEYIISLFTNPDVNKNGAQLVFTSHDMYTLNSKVFRRDEIWFAFKNDEESTIVHSLADIKGEDNRTARIDASFSKKYLSGRYGADPYYNKMIKWEDLFGE